MDGNEQVGLVGADFVGPLLQRDPCVGAARVPDVEAARGQDRPHALGDVQCKILFPDAVVVRAGVFAAVPRIDEHRFYAEAERFAFRLFLLACLAGGGRRLSFFFGRERCKVTGGVLGRIGRRVFFEDLLEQGFLPEAVVNYIALLGWSPEDNREIFSLDELIKEFDYHRINKSPSVFDYMKLKWMNGEYIKAMDDDKFFEMAEPYLKSTITKNMDLHKIADMVKTRIEVFPDIPDLIDFFETLPEYDPSMYEHKKMKTNRETSLDVLRKLLPVFEQQEDYSNDALYQLLTGFAAENEYKNGYVLWPVRTAVSGKQMTPAGATEIMELLGKEESLARIRKGIELLENS